MWGYDFDTESNVVDVYVRYLRRKLGDEHIETVRLMGYRFRAPRGWPLVLVETTRVGADRGPADRMR